MAAILIKMVEIDLIIPYEKNAKKHPAMHVEQIAKSISNFGFNVPILVDKANVIVTGGGRYLATIKLNLKKAPEISLFLSECIHIRVQCWRAAGMLNVSGMRISHMVARIRRVFTRSGNWPKYFQLEYALVNPTGSSLPNHLSSTP
jgi:hypothetical protein